MRLPTVSNIRDDDRRRADILVVHVGTTARFVKVTNNQKLKRIIEEYEEQGWDTKSLGGYLIIGSRICQG